MHIQTYKHKKHFLYPTGFISLLLLATLCIWYLQQRQAFVVLKAKEVTWWNENMNYAKNYTKSRADLNMPIEPEEEMFKVHPKREFIEINLTSNANENKIKLDFAQLAIRELISTKDTVKGVHFSFDNQAKFWTLIRTLDICEVEKAPVYVGETNNIWVFNLKPKPVLPEIEYPRYYCGGNLKTSEQIEIEKEIARQAKIKHLIATIKPFWLSGFLLLTIIVLSFIRIWRMFR
jgi:hypothetical protein